MGVIHQIAVSRSIPNYRSQTPMTGSYADPNDGFLRLPNLSRLTIDPGSIKWGGQVQAVKKDTKPQIEVLDIENRRHPRFDIHLPIEYYQIKSSITHTGNLSEGGSLIYLPQETDVSQYVRLKLFFSSSSEVKAIKVLAEVVWMDNQLGKDSDYYSHGVKFLDISSKDERKLRNFLRNLSSPLDDVADLYRMRHYMEIEAWARYRYGLTFQPSLKGSCDKFKILFKETAENQGE